MARLNTHMQKETVRFDTAAEIPLGEMNLLLRMLSVDAQQDLQAGYFQDNNAAFKPVLATPRQIRLHSVLSAITICHGAVLLVRR